MTTPNPATASTPDLSPILADFQKSRASVSSLSAPAIPGVYAVFLKKPVLPAPFLPGEDGLIYLGLSTNLAARQFEQHFATGSTGFSTLRRSIGAILKSELALRAIPRAPGNVESNVKNYSFDKDGDRRLTDWLCDHLEIGIHASLDYQALESHLLLALRPLLNLKGWPNPHAETIKKLRKICSDEARAARR